MKLIDNGITIIAEMNGMMVATIIKDTNLWKVKFKNGMFETFSSKEMAISRVQSISVLSE